MKKWLTLVVMTAILCLLTACGLQPVSEKQKKTDLIQSAEVQNCYASKFAPQSEYVLKEYSLIKEQINKEDKEDIVFCNAVVENEYFRVSFQAQQLYNHYEKGGWIMDEITITEREVVPLKGPDNQLVVDYINGNASYRHGTFYYNGEHRFWQEEDTRLAGDRASEYDAQANVAKVYAELRSPVQRTVGYYTMAFDSYNDWILIPEGDREAEDLHAEEWIVDYTCALGTYTWPKGENGWGRSSVFYSSWPGGTITIKSITLEKVIFDLHITEENENATVEFLTGENLEAEFDPQRASFVPAIKGEYKEDMRYSVDNNRWYATWDENMSRITE